jgi:glycosyltransferase involved in cell wall biosynthesis
MKISVCMATYNGEEYIYSQLESILSQLKPCDEVIISDDNSSDSTIEIVQSFNDARIKIFKNSFEKGYSGNFESALTKATGDVIFLSDQDDVWCESKVSQSLKAIELYDFVVSDNTVVDASLHEIYRSHFVEYGTKTGFLNNFLRPRYVGACMVFKRNVLEKSLPFPKKRKLAAHDYWICLIAELYFSVHMLNTPLIKYRRHSKNASNGGNKSMNPLILKVKVRAYVLYALLINYLNTKRKKVT